MRAQGLGTVLAVGTSVKNLKLGDTVECLPGWAEYAVLSAKNLKKRTPLKGIRITDYLGTLGTPGQCLWSMPKGLQD